jgi:hypothetical protein
MQNNSRDSLGELKHYLGWSVFSKAEWKTEGPKKTAVQFETTCQSGSLLEISEFNCGRLS